jgi:hypothetical protein
MGLLRFISKLTGIEKKIRWSRAKKIEAIWPATLEKFYVYVDPYLNVAIFLTPQDHKTLRVYIGNIVEAHTWQEFDLKGNKIGEKELPKHTINWKINPLNVLLRHSFAPPDQRISEGKIVSHEEFTEEINQRWISRKKNEHIEIINMQGNLG